MFFDLDDDSDDTDKVISHDAGILAHPRHSRAPRTGQRPKLFGRRRSAHRPAARAGRRADAAADPLEAASEPQVLARPTPSHPRHTTTFSPAHPAAHTDADAHALPTRTL